MFNQKTNIILFIDRSGVGLFGGNLTQIVGLQIPSTIIMDMEIVSKDGLYSLIKQWVKQYNLIGSHIVMIFSESTYFEKIFSISEQSQVETDILKFFEMVPYDSIWSKVYPHEKGKRAVAINKLFYEGLHQGFLLQGLPTKTVIPAFALGALGKKRILDKELYDYVIANVDTLSKYSLLDPQDISSTLPVTVSTPGGAGSAKKKSNLPLLVGVFAILLLVLGVVVFLQYR